MTTDCPSCGRPLDTHDRHLRFTLPDVVLDSPDQEQAPDTWMSGPDARESVMLSVPGLGSFVRALLPVRLTGGYTLTYGVWLAVDDGQFRTVFDTWWAPEYPQLRMTGTLANAVPPWGLHGAPVQTVIRDPDQTPYCDRSADPQLDRVLRDEWPHEVVLTAVDGAP